MNSPHSPVCVQCGRSRGPRAATAAPLPLCPLCLKRRKRRARSLGYALVDAVTNGQTERAESIVRSILLVSTIN